MAHAGAAHLFEQAAAQDDASGEGERRQGRRHPGKPHLQPDRMIFMHVIVLEGIAHMLVKPCKLVFTRIFVQICQQMFDVNASSGAVILR